MKAMFGRSGKDWTDVENDLLVADYLDMLAIDLEGGKIAKTERRRNLQDLGLGARSLKSIERKQQNVSAVLALLGHRWASGLVPMANYQESLVDAIGRNHALVGIDRLLERDLRPADLPSLASTDVMVPPPSRSQETLPTRLLELVRKVDPAERDRRARELGKAGEAFVVDIERRRVSERGQHDLVGDVRWVADLDGDGLGYDVRSFDPEGRPIHIEVKTTNGGDATPFLLTANEERVSRIDPDWKLYRVHRFFRDPRIFVLDPPLDDRAAMEIAVWRVSPGVHPSRPTVP